MLKTIVLAAAIAAGTALMPAGAGAFPLGQDKSGVAAATDMLLVREGCGPGRQWSERLRRCTRDTPRARARDVIQDVRCGPGFRYSDRLRRCVRR